MHFVIVRKHERSAVSVGLSNLASMLPAVPTLTVFRDVWERSRDFPFQSTVKRFRLRKLPRSSGPHRESFEHLMFRVNAPVST